MKKLIIFIFSVVLLGSCTKDKEFKGNVGDEHQGGIVFYLDSNGGGLIAADEDQSPGLEWGCYGTAVNGADGTAIGTGNQNTVEILDTCSSILVAADICANLSHRGYNDWFLPSKDELNLMWKNLADSDGDSINLGPRDPNNIGSFEDYGYWSSTESDTILALGQYFSKGNQDSYAKTSTFYVRAIRAF
tara:strand:- start:7 stop:573 length:567 start_codon:yes stop_codon:yes gene_type:complete